MDPTASRAPHMTTELRGPRGWIVLVASGQEDLYEHVRHAFQADNKVQVVMDRRIDSRRNPPLVSDRLSTHGVAVIRREPEVRQRLCAHCND